uniref:Uncharacterized protein n=1 Tax=Triticum urartu TaxID=4572 RepID=A0A8R7PPL7_TRIUA
LIPTTAARCSTTSPGQGQALPRRERGIPHREQFARDGRTTPGDAVCEILDVALQCIWISLAVRCLSSCGSSTGARDHLPSPIFPLSTPARMQFSRCIHAVRSAFACSRPAGGVERMCVVPTVMFTAAWCFSAVCSFQR